MLDQKVNLNKMSKSYHLGGAVAHATNVVVNRCVNNEGDALALLADLTKKAEKIQSKFCKIDGRIERIDDGFELTATFKFCCGAEGLVFRSALL